MTAHTDNTNSSGNTSPSQHLSKQQLSRLARNIKLWALDLGFDAVGISDTNLGKHENYLSNWLAKNRHGEMEYMQKHGTKRTRPAELIAGTQRVISVRMDYAPADIDQAETVLQQSRVGYISRYALGRDYHKVMRNRLQKLAKRINQDIGDFGYRAFTDSAPVMEKAIAEKAGLGWIGKHSNLLDSKTGSWFFLGELYVSLALPIDDKATNHCGSCTKCIDVCPTQAIVGPYQVDARLCISYLTIELKDSIPVELRSQMGNRIYGCDDCQLVCPWNKFAQTTKESDFSPRAELTDVKLLDLFSWDESRFLKNTEGTVIRRIGYHSWLRNIAVALGNAEPSQKIIHALEKRLAETTDFVQEHINWAISEQRSRLK